MVVAFLQSAVECLSSTSVYGFKNVYICFFSVLKRHLLFIMVLVSLSRFHKTINDSMITKML